jgi:hypothetical protein
MTFGNTFGIWLWLCFTNCSINEERLNNLQDWPCVACTALWTAETSDWWAGWTCRWLLVSCRSLKHTNNNTYNDNDEMRSYHWKINKTQHVVHIERTLHFVKIITDLHTLHIVPLNFMHNTRSMINTAHCALQSSSLTLVCYTLSSNNFMHNMRWMIYMPPGNNTAACHSVTKLSYGWIFPRLRIDLNFFTWRNCSCERWGPFP